MARIKSALSAGSIKAAQKATPRLKRKRKPDLDTIANRPIRPPAPSEPPPLVMPEDSMPATERQRMTQRIILLAARQIGQDLATYGIVLVLARILFFGERYRNHILKTNERTVATEPF
jgi:hypothetical protein